MVQARPQPTSCEEFLELLVLEGVPVQMTTDRARADYIVGGTSEETKPGWARWLMTGNAHSDDAASIEIAGVQRKLIVYAYAVNKKFTLHGQQTAAEACAKHLKKWIEDGAR
jgi:hypothetical protein